MNVTLEEFKGLIELAGYYSTPTADRYNDNFVKHLMDENKADMEFRHFIKTHYPEALAEWNALKKIGE